MIIIDDPIKNLSDFEKKENRKRMIKWYNSISLPIVVSTK